MPSFLSVLGKSNIGVFPHDCESVGILFSERLKRREVLERSVKSAFRYRAIDRGYSRLLNRSQQLGTGRCVQMSKRAAK